jgi:hypothetical protein
MEAKGLEFKIKFIRYKNVDLEGEVVQDEKLQE